MKNKKFIIFSFTILFSLVFVWQGCKFEKIENPYSDEKFDAPELTYFWKGQVTDLKNVDLDMSGTKVSYTSTDGETRETVVEGNNFSFSSDKPFSGDYNIIVEKDNYIASNKQFVYKNAKFRPLVISNFKMKQLNAPQNMKAGDEIIFQEGESGVKIIASVPEGTIFTLNGVEMDNVDIIITPIESGYLDGEKNIKEGKMGMDLATFDLEPKGLQFDNPMTLKITPSFAIGPDDDLNVAYKSKNSDIWDESTQQQVDYDDETNLLVFEVKSFGNADDTSDKKNILFGGGGSGNVYTSLEVTVSTVKEGFVVYDYKIATNCTNQGSAINHTFTDKNYIIGDNPILENALTSSIYEGEIVRTTVEDHYIELSSSPHENDIENAIAEYLMLGGTDLDANDRSGFYQILKANKTEESQMTFLDQDTKALSSYADAYGDLDVTIDLCKSYILVCYYDVKTVTISDITNVSYTKYNGSYTRFLDAGNIFIEEIDCPNVTPCHQGGGSGSGK